MCVYTLPCRDVGVWPRLHASRIARSDIHSRQRTEGIGIMTAITTTIMAETTGEITTGITTETTETTETTMAITTATTAAMAAKTATATDPDCRTAKNSGLDVTTRNKMPWLRASIS